MTYVFALKQPVARGTTRTGSTVPVLVRAVFEGDDPLDGVVRLERLRGDEAYAQDILDLLQFALDLADLPDEYSGLAGRPPLSASSTLPGLALVIGDYLRRTPSARLVVGSLDDWPPPPGWVVAEAEPGAIH